MKLDRRQFIGLVGAALMHPALLQAQGSPDRPIHLLVPYAPGGPTDILARLIAPRMGELLGQTAVVDNVPGAGGNIGMAKGARAAPDGQILTVVAPNVVINPLLYAHAGYDPAELMPVTVAVRSAVVVSVHPSMAATTLRDLVAQVKSQPGRHAYASPGIGTPPHLVAEQLRLSLGLDLVHAPFSSAGQAVGAAVSNQVPIVFSSTPPAIAQVTAGRLRALAVTGARRDMKLPDTPTMAEAGFDSVDGEGWFGFMVPKATPPERIAALYRALVQCIDNPSIRERLAGLGFDPVMIPPEASVALV